MENVFCVHFHSSIKMVPPLNAGEYTSLYQLLNLWDNRKHYHNSRYSTEILSPYYGSPKKSSTESQILSKIYFIWNDTNQAVMTEVDILQETQLPQLHREQPLKPIPFT